MLYRKYEKLLVHNKDDLRARNFQDPDRNNHWKLPLVLVGIDTRSYQQYRRRFYPEGIDLARHTHFDWCKRLPL